MEPATGVKTEELFQLSDRVNRIAESPTMVVLQAAAALKAKGVDVADFGAGEPDFPTPEHIKRAAIQALDENRTKYTPVPGIPELRKAICEWHARELGLVLPAGRMRRQRRRQAFHLQCRLRADQSGRRSRHRRALLGQLSRHRQIRGRQAGDPGNDRSRQFRDARGGAGKTDHFAHAHGHRRFAEQSFRRGDPAGRIREDSGRLPAQGRLAARRRVLFALHVRRREAVFDRERSGFEEFA